MSQVIEFPPKLFTFPTKTFWFLYHLFLTPFKVFHEILLVLQHIGRVYRLEKVCLFFFLASYFSLFFFFINLLFLFLSFHKNKIMLGFFLENLCSFSVFLVNKKKLYLYYIFFLFLLHEPIQILVMFLLIYYFGLLKCSNTYLNGIKWEGRHLFLNKFCLYIYIYILFCINWM